MFHRSLIPEQYEAFSDVLLKGSWEKVRLGIRNLSCANLDHQQGSTVGLGEAPDPLFLQRPDLDPVPGGGGTFLKAADGSWVKTRTLSVGKTLLLVWESE